MKKQSKKLHMKDSIYFLKQFLTGLGSVLTLFAFGWFLETIITVISPVLFGIMVNHIVYYKNLHLFLKLSSIFLFILLLECVMFYLLYELYNLLWNTLIFRIRIKMFNHFVDMDTEELLNSSYGDTSNLILWQVIECVHFLIRNVIHNFNNYIKIFACSVILFVIHPVIGLIVLFMLPLNYFLTKKNSTKIRHENDKNTDDYGIYSGWLNEMLSALPQIRILNAENYVLQLLNLKQKNIMDTDLKSEILSVQTSESLNVTNMILQMVMYLLLAIATVYYSMTIGSIIVVLTFFTYLKDALKTATDNHVSAQKRMSIITRIHEHLEKPLESSQWNGSEVVESLTGKIELEKVCFSYRNGTKLFDELSLSINCGEKIAIVGESGCGKSSLSYLLLGFFRATSGSIYFENKPGYKKDILTFTLESIREKIGIAQQEITIFNGTFKENIQLGNQNSTIDAIMEASKAAGIHNFIMECENQYDTLIGNKGRKLSGGQEQRIAMARIFLRNPDIILLDEATSALDEITENLVLQSWTQSWANKTAIVISHRLSSVLLCDKIAIMENGKIVEIGSTEEIYNKSHRFQTLFALRRAQNEQLELS